MQITPEIAQIIMRGGNSLEIAEVSLRSGFNDAFYGLKKPPMVLPL